MNPGAAIQPTSEVERLPTRLEFLQALYGEDAPGQLVLWRKSDKLAHWLPATDLPQVETIQTTHDVYFAVCLHDQEAALRASGKKDPTRVRGSAESTVAMPGLWADVDVHGPAHKSTDLPPSPQAARDLVARFPLAPTAVVHSGYGLQVWWLFRELWVFEGPEERERALRLSRRFQATLRAYAAESGWTVDETSDLARVLRLPETLNAKLDRAVPVEVVEWNPEARHNPDDFEAYLVEDPGHAGPERHGGPSTAAVLAGVPEGSRDTELFRLACKLRQADLPREWVERLILEAAGKCSPPFPKEEALAKVASAFRYPRGGAFVSFVSSLPAQFAPFRHLPPERPEAPALPADLLPPALRPWLVDIAERMQVPLEFPAVPALVGLAAVAGRRVGIHPKAKDDWLVVPNLWGAIIARPGKLKSPTLAETLKPVRRIEEEDLRRHGDRLARQGARLESLRAKESALKDLLKQAHKGRGDRSPEDLEKELETVHREVTKLRSGLAEPRLIVNDSTVEKLGELLADNPNGLLLERDELAGWLRSLEREDRKSDREFFQEAWNGNTPFTCDRIGRGTIPVEHVCLSVIGGIQPAKFARYISEAISGAYAADGLLQRFQLLVWPEDPEEWQLVDRAPDAGARDQAAAIYRALSRLGPGLPAKGRGGLPALRFEPGAQRLFYDWLTELEREVRSPQMGGWPAFESHLAKYRSLMPSLALLFHLTEVAGEKAVPPVSLDAARRAGDWCEYLKAHARKVYAAELEQGLAAASALASLVTRGVVGDGSTVRDITRARRSGLSSPEQVEAALGVLEEHGWVEVQVHETGGRPTRVIRVNPQAVEVAR